MYPQWLNADYTDCIYAVQRKRPKENTQLCILHGLFISFLTISPMPAETYHFHVYMSLSRPTVPIKSILAHIFHYKDQILEKWFVKFWWYQRMSAVLGHSLQEKLVILITGLVTVQQLQCGHQQGALGLDFCGRSGRWVGYC